MINDFLDNLGAHQYEKIINRNSTKEINKIYDEYFWEEYYNNTKEKKNN